MTCEKEFKESELVEYVKTGPGGQQKPKSVRLVGPSSEPVTPEATDLEPMTDQQDELEEEQTNERPTLTPGGGQGGYLRTNAFVSSTKLEALIDDLVEVRRTEAEFSAVVFSQFTGFLDLIEKVLKRDHFR